MRSISLAVIDENSEAAALRKIIEKKDQEISDLKELLNICIKKFIEEEKEDDIFFTNEELTTGNSGKVWMDIMNNGIRFSVVYTEEEIHERELDINSCIKSLFK